MAQWHVDRLIILLLLLASHQVTGQPHNFLRYSVADGLPQSQIHVAYSDSHGYLWLGTPGSGLSRFDGLYFEHFSIKNGLPSNTIHTFWEEQDGQFWVGTAAGLAYYQGNHLVPVVPSLTSTLSVTAIAQQTDSTLWVGTDRGIYQYLKREKRLEKVKLNVLLDQLTIQAFYPGQKGLWVATPRGAWHLGDTLSHFNRQSGLGGEDVRAFTQGPNGQLWIVTYNQGITILNEATMQVTGSRQPPALVRALCAYIDPEHKIWIGTQDRGIFIYDPPTNRWQNITEDNGLPQNDVRAILPDQWGNIWITMSGGGLAKYLGQYFVQYTQRNGLPDNRVYALTEDRQNQLWISTGSEGITLYNSQKGFRSMNRDSGLINVPVRTMQEDRQSNMWIGTDGLGLFLFDSTGISRYSQLEGLPGNWIRKVVEDGEGNIWVATPADGMARIRKGRHSGLTIDRIGLEENLEERDISTMQVDEQGRVWFATQQGVLGYFEYGRLGGLFRSEAGLPNVEIRSIAFDELNRIWLATAGNGIYYADANANGRSFKPLASGGNSLASLNVFSLVFDPDGHLWAGHDRGVDKIVLDAKGNVVDIQQFDQNEGFLGLETYPDAALVDHQGQLWFGTTNGLIKHQPTDHKPETATPRIHLRTISLFYNPLETTAFSSWAQPGGIRPGLLLPHQQNHLGFLFKGINLSDPQNVQYRWRLIGREEEWSPLNTNESVNYSNLAPGTYTFQVQACSGEDNCSPPVEAAFRIKKPFWQLLWFRLTSILIFATLIWVLFQWRIRSIQRKETARREKLEVQNHLLQLEQKALQLQMNPHFIFNALNSIQSLVSTQDFQTARQEINHFASLMRIILSNSRKQKISLQEEIDTLEKYLRMEQFCQRIDFTYHIHPPEEIDAEEIAIPPMLIQPFVENAIIHGISHLQDKGTIDIRFSLTNELLVCEINDNGVGRKQAAELRQNKSSDHQSTAMQVNRERLEALFAGQADDALEVIDKVSKNGNPAGTRVILRIPAELSF